MRRVALFTGNRADWGLLQPLAAALAMASDIELKLWVGGEHWQSGTVAEVREADLAPISALGDYRASPPSPMKSISKSIDLTQTHLSQASYLLAQQRPDIVLMLGDRMEAFAVAYACFYSSSWLLHLGGGDWTEGGCPDDRLRWLISELAHLHGGLSMPSCEALYARGEEAWRIRFLGSPALDTIRQLPLRSKASLCEELGFDPEKPLVLFTQHPVPTESEAETLAALQASLEALRLEGCQVVATYPNRDAHGQAVYQAIEAHQAQAWPGFAWRHSLGHNQYLTWLAACDAVVGNSSSGLYETAYFRKPSLTIGPRQAGRLRADNVLAVPYGVASVRAGLRTVLHDKAFKQRCARSENPFGDGRCAERLLNWVTQVDLAPQYRQKWRHQEPQYSPGKALLPI